jgi:hypothetical protein
VQLSVAGVSQADEGVVVLAVESGDGVRRLGRASLDSAAVHGDVGHAGSGAAQFPPIVDPFGGRVVEGCEVAEHGRHTDMIPRLVGSAVPGSPRPGRPPRRACFAKRADGPNYYIRALCRRARAISVTS